MLHIQDGPTVNVMFQAHTFEGQFSRSDTFGSAPGFAANRCPDPNP